MPQKLIIFDFDGTLYHTAPGIHSAINNVLHDRGHDSIDYETAVQFIGGGFKALAEKLGIHSENETSKIERLVKDFTNAYKKTFKEQSRLYNGVKQFFEWSHHEAAIVSNKSEWFIHELVTRCHTLSQVNWRSIIGGDSLAAKKPDPLPITTTMQRAGVSPENTLIIGDGIPDVLAAKAAGIPCIVVDYGYTEPQQLLAHGATHCISSLEELPDYIEQM